LRRFSGGHADAVDDGEGLLDRFGERQQLLRSQFWLNQTEAIEASNLERRTRPSRLDLGDLDRIEFGAIVAFELRIVRTRVTFCGDLKNLTRWSQPGTSVWPKSVRETRKTRAA
jgi:hypothetical protein